jgi:hypothetical protein
MKVDGYSFAFEALLGDVAQITLHPLEFDVFEFFD